MKERIQRITLFLWFDNQAEEAVNRIGGKGSDPRGLTPCPTIRSQLAKAGAYCGALTAYVYSFSGGVMR